MFLASSFVVKRMRCREYNVAPMRPTTCLLCGGDAEIGPSILQDGGPRSERLAVRCGELCGGPCRGYIITSGLLEPGAIPADVGERLSKLAAERFRETGSGSFEIEREPREVDEAMSSEETARGADRRAGRVRQPGSSPAPYPCSGGGSDRREPLD